MGASLGPNHAPCERDQCLRLPRHALLQKSCILLLVASVLQDPSELDEVLPRLVKCVEEAQGGTLLSVALQLEGLGEEPGGGRGGEINKRTQACTSQQTERGACTHRASARASGGAPAHSLSCLDEGKRYWRNSPKPWPERAPLPMFPAEAEDWTRRRRGGHAATRNACATEPPSRHTSRGAGGCEPTAPAWCEHVCEQEGGGEGRIVLVTSGRGEEGGFAKSNGHPKILCGGGVTAQTTYTLRTHRHNKERIGRDTGEAGYRRREIDGKDAEKHITGTSTSR